MAQESKIQITPDMKISDIMALNAGAADVMLSYGLHCVGCSINEFDTLEQGSRIHSMREDELQCLLDDLNDLFSEQKAYEEKGITLTERALSKIKEFQQIEQKTDCPLYVQFQIDEESGEKAFGLDFTEKVLDSHTKLDFDTLILVFDTATFDELEGLIMDYKEGPYEEGFLFRQQKRK